MAAFEGNSAILLKKIYKIYHLGTDEGKNSLEAAQTLECLAFLLASRKTLKACVIKRISVSIRNIKCILFAKIHHAIIYCILFLTVAKL